MPEGKHKFEQYVGGQEGMEFEWDVFDSVDTKNLKYQKELEKVSKPNGFVFFRDALELVKKFQPGDPRNPGRPFVRELRMEIIEILDLFEEKDMDRLKFYTAVGTPLDKQHGIDGLFEYESKDENLYRITLDAATVSEAEKIKGGRVVKADILVSEKDIKLEDEKELPIKIRELAEKIVEILNSQQKANEMKNKNSAS